MHVKPSGRTDIFVKYAKSSPYSRPTQSCVHIPIRLQYFISYFLTEASAQWRASVRSYTGGSYHDVFWL